MSPKSIAVLLVILALGVASSTTSPSTRIYENKIKTAIQNIFTNLRENGIPSMNITSLDPLDYPRFELNFDNETLATVSLNLTDILVTGMTQVEIPELTFKLVGLHFTFTLKWPKTDGKCNYDLSADVYLKPMNHLFGNGAFSFSAEDFQITGEGKLSLQSDLKHIHLESFSMGVALKSLAAHIEGLMGDPQFSETASKAISVAIPGLLDEFHQEVTDFISPIVQDAANEALKNITIGEIIGFYEMRLPSPQPIKFNYL